MNDSSGSDQPLFVVAHDTPTQILPLVGTALPTGGAALAVSLQGAPAVIEYYENRGQSLPATSVSVVLPASSTGKAQLLTNTLISVRAGATLEVATFRVMRGATPLATFEVEAQANRTTTLMIPMKYFSSGVSGGSQPGQLIVESVNAAGAGAQYYVNVAGQQA